VASLKLFLMPVVIKLTRNRGSAFLAASLSGKTAFRQFRQKCQLALRSFKNRIPDPRHGVSSPEPHIHDIRKLYVF
jgi:hypothetical protein